MEAKLQGVVDLQKLLGDSISTLEIGLDENVEKAIKSNLLTLTEAENTESIVLKNKDRWHKEGMKSLLDSFDSALEGHLSVLDEVPDNTKDKAKAVLTKYKDRLSDLDTQLNELKTKLNDGISDTEAKSLIAQKEAEVKRMKETHVPKAEIEALNQQIKMLKDTYVPKETAEMTAKELKKAKAELEKLNTITQREQVVSAAMKSKILREDIADSPIADVIIYEAVNKYLDSKTFNDNVKAKFTLDPDTRRVVLRQRKAEDLSIAVDGKVLTVDDVIADALIEYKLNKKSDGNSITSTFTSSGSSSSKLPKGVQNKMLTGIL